MERENIKELVAFLEGALETKIDYSYAGTYIDFYIYLKEYDYAIVKVQLKNKDLKEIAREVMDKMYDEEYYFYKASVLEYIVKDAINKNELEQFQVLTEGLLRWCGCEWNLNDITEYKVTENEDCFILEFNDPDGHWVWDLDFDECLLKGNDDVEEELRKVD